MRTVLSIILLLASSFVSPLLAQIKIIGSEERQESFNPEKSADSSAIAFDRKIIDAGCIKEDGGVRKYSFGFINAGTKTLKISGITSNCTCVEAVAANRIVGVGERSSIEVSYNPQGHPGRFVRRIFVYLEGSDKPAALLELKVRVSSADSLSREYPVQCGNLRMRRDHVCIRSGIKAVESVRVIGQGHSAINLRCDSAFLPERITARFEPQRLAPGEKGKLIISYDGETVKSGVYPLYIKGSGVSPRDAKVTIEVK